MGKDFCLLTIETLNLNLVDIRGIDVQPLLEQLTIFPDTKKEFDFCGRKVILAVIGESHFILVADEFLELLVCKILPKDFFKGILVLDRKLGQELDNCTCQYETEGFSYLFTSRFIKYCPKNGFKFESEGILIHAWVEDFPFFNQNNELIPCQTKLRLHQINDRKLCLQTRHDYPAPDAISVLTKSIWEFPLKRSK